MLKRFARCNAVFCLAGPDHIPSDGHAPASLGHEELVAWPLLVQLLPKWLMLLDPAPSPLESLQSSQAPLSSRLDNDAICRQPTVVCLVWHLCVPVKPVCMVLKPTTHIRKLSTDHDPSKSKSNNLQKNDHLPTIRRTCGCVLLSRCSKCLLLRCSKRFPLVPNTADDMHHWHVAGHLGTRAMLQIN